MAEIQYRIPAGRRHGGILDLRKDKFIVCSAASQRVRPDPASQNILARTTQECVAAGTSTENVVITAAPQDVVARTTVHRAIHHAQPAIESVIAATESDISGDRAPIADVVRSDAEAQAAG